MRRSLWQSPRERHHYCIWHVCTLTCMRVCMHLCMGNCYRRPRWHAYTHTYINGPFTTLARTWHIAWDLPAETKSSISHGFYVKNTTHILVYSGFFQPAPLHFFFFFTFSSSFSVKFFLQLVLTTYRHGSEVQFYLKIRFYWTIKFIEKKPLSSVPPRTSVTMRAPQWLTVAWFFLSLFGLVLNSLAWYWVCLAWFKVCFGLLLSLFWVGSESVWLGWFWVCLAWLVLSLFGLVGSES